MTTIFIKEIFLEFFTIVFSFNIQTVIECLFLYIEVRLRELNATQFNEITNSIELKKNSESTINYTNFFNQIPNSVLDKLLILLLMNNFLSKKKKQNREIIPYTTYQIIFSEAGLCFRRQQNIRISQLKIIYFVLYFLGLKVGEIRWLTKEHFQKAKEIHTFNLTLLKNKTITRNLNTEILRHLSFIEKDINFFFTKSGFKYLGCMKSNTDEVAEKSNFLNFINYDLENTSRKREFQVIYTSYSFRTNFILNSLEFTPTEELVEMVGLRDVNVALSYKD